METVSTNVISVPWSIALGLYLVAALGTFAPVALAWVSGVKLKDDGNKFEDAVHFSADARVRLQQHFTRIRGTLEFWKKYAEIYRRFHYYTLWWTIPSSVVVPILTQAVTMSLLSKAFITCVSAHTAINLALHRAFKVDLNYRAYRQGESNFYDLYRRMLDRPESFGKTEEERLSSYFEQVESLRANVRNAEIDNTPALEDREKK